MSKPVAIVLAVLGWIGVVVALRFHDLVPHASPAEIRPFLIALVVFSVVTTALLIKTLTSKPKA
jgi:hypothetical protein